MARNPVGRNWISSKGDDTRRPPTAPTSVLPNPMNSYGFCRWVLCIWSSYTPKLRTTALADTIGFHCVSTTLMLVKAVAVGCAQILSFLVRFAAPPLMGTTDTPCCSSRGRRRHTCGSQSRTRSPGGGVHSRRMDSHRSRRRARQRRSRGRARSRRCRRCRPCCREERRSPAGLRALRLPTGAQMTGEGGDDGRTGV